MTRLNLRVRQRGSLARIRGIEIEAIEQAVTVSCVPGSPFGMALVRGQIIPVIRLGEANGCLVVGRIRGEAVGIAGLEVLGFDFLEESPVEVIEQLASEFHLSRMPTAVPSGETTLEDVSRGLRAERAEILPDATSGNVDRFESEVDLDVGAMFDRLTQQQRLSPQVVEEQQ